MIEINFWRLLIAGLVEMVSLLLICSHYIIVVASYKLSCMNLKPDKLSKFPAWNYPNPGQTVLANHFDTPYC